MRVRDKDKFGFDFGYATGALVGGAGAVAVDGDILSVNVMGPGYLSSPVNMTDPNGAVVAITIKGRSIGGSDPDATKVSFLLSCPGYDSSGNLTARTRVCYGTQWLRQPYPASSNSTGARYETSSGSDCTQYIVLDDYIYQGETIVSVAIASGFYSLSNASSGLTTFANNSTLPAPRCKVYPVTLPFEYVSGTTVTVEYTVTHAYFQDGNMVPYVLITVTDKNGTSVTGIATAVNDTVRRRNSTANPLPCYRAVIDISTLADGLCFHSCIARPWRGGSASCFNTLTDGFGATSWPNSSRSLHYNCPATTPFRKDVAGTYGQSYAYVAPTAASPSGFNGNDATGAASSTPATANALPFATIRAAQAAIAAYNLSNFGRNDCGNSIIRMVAGSYTGFGTTGTIAAVGDVWLTVTLDLATATVPSDVIFNAAATGRQSPRRCRFKDIQLKAVAGQITIQNDESNTTWGSGFINEIDHDGCEINSNGQTGLQMWSKCGRLTAINCTALSGGGAVFWGAGATTNYKTFFVAIDCSIMQGTSKISCNIMRGNTQNSASSSYFTPNIEYSMGSTFSALTPLDQSNPFQYTIWIGNSVYKQGATPWRCAGMTWGHAIYNQLHEVLTGGKPIECSADSSGNAAQAEIELGMIGTPGDGMNICYHLTSYTITSGLNSFATNSGSTRVDVTAVAHGLYTGQEIYIYDSTSPTFGGITYANLSGLRTITVDDADHFHYSAGTSASSSATGGAAGMKFSCRNDLRTIGGSKRAIGVGLIGGDWNTKGDLFPSAPANEQTTDGYKFENIFVRYHVGLKGIVVQNSQAGHPGDLPGELFTAGQTIQKEKHAATLTYTSDLSGAGGGGGNYTPLTGSNSKGKHVLANSQFGVRVPFAIDIFGNTRRQDATGHIGPVEGAP